MTHVTLTDETGRSQAIPIVENGFSVEIAVRPVRLEWRGPRGREVLDFPDVLGQIREQRREAMRLLGIPQGDAEAVRNVPRR